MPLDFLVSEIYTEKPKRRELYCLHSFWIEKQGSIY